MFVDKREVYPPHYTKPLTGLHSCLNPCISSWHTSLLFTNNISFIVITTIYLWFIACIFLYKKTHGLLEDTEKKNWRLPELRHLHGMSTVGSHSVPPRRKEHSKVWNGVVEPLDAELQYPSTLHIIQEGQRLYESTFFFHPHTFLSRNMKSFF